MNTVLVGYCVLAVVTMAAQDALGSTMVVAINANRSRLAGTLDAFGDFAQRYGAGVMAGSVVKWGLGSWETFLIVAVTGATSFFCTSSVTELANRALKPKT